jgi:hypothetical protein
MENNHRTANRAARLAALLPLWHAGRLDHLTFQAIADLTGVGNRSTALRDMRELPTVEILRDLYARRFGSIPRRRLVRRNRKRL